MGTVIKCLRHIAALNATWWAWVIAQRKVVVRPAAPRSAPLAFRGAQSVLKS